MFRLLHNNQERKKWIETDLTGKRLLTFPLLNKGIAFTADERHQFHLLGKLPEQVQSLTQQAQLAYQQMLEYQIPIHRKIYLLNLLERNETLFYRVLRDHWAELLPIVYTPLVGDAVKSFSRCYRRARGLYISYPQIEHIDTIINNRSFSDIQILCVTDGEAVLGIGDQGAGSMEIPIAKLMVYSACGAVYPGLTLPIVLDVGTDNPELLEDPDYVGWRHPRIRGEQYHDFLHKFITAVHKNFPQAMLHWEDFAAANARLALEQAETFNQLTFNDDIQGTGIVAVAAVLAGLKAQGLTITQADIVIFGAGAAGCGIADALVAQMQHEGLSERQALARIWLIDRNGLVVSTNNQPSWRGRFAQDLTQHPGLQLTSTSFGDLAEVIELVKPQVLFGCSSQPDAFTNQMLSNMCRGCQHPLIFPLSNPNHQAEAQPKRIIEATKGLAWIATGSPFATVNYQGRERWISQCNNALAFPGLGFGTMAVRAKTIDQNLLSAAVQAIAAHAPVITDPDCGEILPRAADAAFLSKHVALNVAKVAIEQGLAEEQDLDLAIWRQSWFPDDYMPLQLNQQLSYPSAWRGN